jgi:hypothetical protein
MPASVSGGCRLRVADKPEGTVMKIKSVEAFWVHIPIPHDKQHTSDFGRTLSSSSTR